MDKTVISLLSGASALALLGGSQASAAPAVDEVATLQLAQSFAELLDPIPNAQNVLRAEDGCPETTAHELRHDISVGSPEDVVWIIVCKWYC